MWRPTMFLMCLIAALSGTPLRQAEAAHDFSTDRRGGLGDVVDEPTGASATTEETDPGGWSRRQVVRAMVPPATAEGIPPFHLPPAPHSGPCRPPPSWRNRFADLRFGTALCLAAMLPVLIGSPRLLARLVHDSHHSNRAFSCMDIFLPSAFAVYVDRVARWRSPHHRRPDRACGPARRPVGEGGGAEGPVPKNLKQIGWP